MKKERGCAPLYCYLQIEVQAIFPLNADIIFINR